MLAGVIQEAISGAKARATDFSIDAIMSKNAPLLHASRALPLQPTQASRLQEIFRENSISVQSTIQALQRGTIFSENILEGNSIYLRNYTRI